MARSQLKHNFCFDAFWVFGHNFDLQLHQPEHRGKSTSHRARLSREGHSKLFKAADTVLGPATLRLNNSCCMPPGCCFEGDMIHGKKAFRHQLCLSNVPIPHCSCSLLQSCKLVKVSGEESEATGVLNQSTFLSQSKVKQPDKI